MPPLEKVELRKYHTNGGLGVRQRLLKRTYEPILDYSERQCNVAPGNKTTSDKIIQYMVIVVLY